jgi:hypothetical protein
MRRRLPEGYKAAGNVDHCHSNDWWRAAAWRNALADGGQKRRRIPPPQRLRQLPPVEFRCQFRAVRDTVQAQRITWTLGRSPADAHLVASLRSANSMAGGPSTQQPSDRPARPFHSPAMASRSLGPRCSLRAMLTGRFGSYRFFFVTLALWPGTAFAAACGSLAISAECWLGMQRRTPGRA